MKGTRGLAARRSVAGAWLRTIRLCIIAAIFASGSLLQLLFGDGGGELFTISWAWSAGGELMEGFVERIDEIDTVWG